MFCVDENSLSFLRYVPVDIKLRHIYVHEPVMDETERKSAVESYLPVLVIGIVVKKKLKLSNY